MTKTKYIITILVIGILLFFLPNVVNAAEVEVSRNMYSNNGSMKFTFKGLTLDTNHEFEYGLTKRAETEVEKWYSVSELSPTEATVDVLTTTTDIREVINTVDTGYITIKDKTADEVVLSACAVDLKIPFLRLTNFTVIPNGKEFGTSGSYVEIALRNRMNSTAYYQYEKITDQKIIDKYKEIKEANGDYLGLESMLKTTVPTSNWSSFSFWNGYSSNGMNGSGYPQAKISVPDTGLYYLWVYFSGDNLKNVYGYMLVDNLQPEIKLEKIALSDTRNVVLGSTTTLSPTFTPSNTTNKIVTWESSDESVVSVDNGGRITGKKIGSAVITVTSQDGNKKASCTVTVVKSSNNNNGGTQNSGTTSGTQNGGTSNGSTNGGTTNVGSTTGKQDTTKAPGTLPYTGVNVGVVIAIVLVVAGCVFAFIKYRKLKEI